MKRFKLENINDTEIHVIDNSNRFNIKFEKGNFISTCKIVKMKEREKKSLKNQRVILNEIEKWLLSFHKEKL